MRLNGSSLKTTSEELVLREVRFLRSPINHIYNFSKRIWGGDTKSTTSVDMIGGADTKLKI